MQWVELRQNVRDVVHGLFSLRYERALRDDVIELNDLFLLMCYMEVVGLPNPVMLYLLELYPHLLGEFHLWHRRMGMDRSPLANFFLLLTSRSAAARRLLDRRILFFGGKGGVGKTTCAAAAALAASRAGKRVLLVSTDPAHSTSDIFEQPFGREPRQVLPNLFGLEIDATFEAGRYVGEVKEQVRDLFSPTVATAANRQIDLAASMPGVGDVALFDRLTQIVADASSPYDLVVFDTAPTGHTVRLLQMPELLRTWIDALTAHRRQALAREVDPRQAGEQAEAADPILVSLERRRQRLDAVRARLIDHRHTAFILVLVPERLPIEETARAADALTRAGMAIGGIIVNRVLPEGLEGDFYAARRRQETVYRDEIDERFAARERFTMTQLESDVYGIGRLERVSTEIFG